MASAMCRLNWWCSQYLLMSVWPILLAHSIVCYSVLINCAVVLCKALSKPSLQLFFCNDFCLLFMTYKPPKSLLLKAGNINDRTSWALMFSTKVIGTWLNFLQPQTSNSTCSWKCFGYCFISWSSSMWAFWGFISVFIFLMKLKFVEEYGTSIDGFLYDSLLRNKYLRFTISWHLLELLLKVMLERKKWRIISPKALHEALLEKIQTYPYLYPKM